MASTDADMARACYEAALEVDPDIIIMGLAGTVMEKVVSELGCKWAGEIFADRAYNPDGTLVDRRLPGAMIHDGNEAADQMCAMVEAEAIMTADGGRIDTRIDTICVHGDTPGALEIARSVRAALIAADVELKAPIR